MSFDLLSRPQSDTQIAVSRATTLATIRRDAVPPYPTDKAFEFTDVEDWHAAVRGDASEAEGRWRTDGRPQLRMWRAYLFAGFWLAAGVSLGAGAYGISPTGGQNRSWLVAGAAGYFALSMLGLVLSDWLSRRDWRDGFVLLFGSAGCVLVAVAAHFDGGMESPLLFPIVLPVMYIALALNLRAVALCSTSAAVAVATVAWTDPSLARVSSDHLIMFSVLLGAAVVIAMTSAVIRSRLEAAQRSLVVTLHQRAELDDLTGCANQRAFYELLDKEIARAIRVRRPLAAMICDADLMRAFNDAHGHPAGDAALAGVGAALLRVARATDLVARVGGDEFALLMPDTTAADAAVLARRILADRPAAVSPQVSVSIGISQLDPGDPNPARVIREANAALVDAKARGRRNVVIAGENVAATADPHVVRRSVRAETERADRKVVTEAIRQARRESEESRTILDTLVNDAPIGFSFIDRDFRIVLINPALATINGSSPQDQVGRTVAEVVPALWPTVEPLYRRVFEEKKPILEVEVRGPTAEDPTDDHDWLSSYYPVTVDGEVIGLGVVAVDITDRKRLERAQVGLTEAVINAMSNTAEARDPYTAGHQNRVARISAAIATELGHDEDTVHGIELAAAIHDIGKVAVPSEILARPGKLNDAETALVRTHASAGYEILRDIEFPWPIAEMVQQHHERMDGSGYPHQLSGDEIQIGARIIAVADTIDAMGTHRPYRVALGLDKALAAVTDGRGTMFDPAVVDACLRLFDHGPLTAALTSFLRGEQDDLRHDAATVGSVPAVTTA